MKIYVRVIKKKSYQILVYTRHNGQNGDKVTHNYTLPPLPQNLTRHAEPKLGSFVHIPGLVNSHFE